MSKFTRSNFYNKFVIDGRVENDLVDNYWDLFIIKRPLKYLTITQSYIQRPDLLSIQVYGNIQYWWIISKFNNIDDWWNDISVEQVISIPDKNDIEDWYIDVRKLQNDRGL